jgi:hypothetical protein
MTKHETMTKSEGRSSPDNVFVIRASSLIRHSDFVIFTNSSFVIRHFRHSSFVIRNFSHALTD